MQRCAFTPYEGQKPYIFISYAHKDAHLVFPVLEELDRRGYRVWYDDGIAPGSEWPENIAQHLDGCSLTLAFLSPNSVASDNCRREMTFALSKRKPFLGIMLQPTEMSLGMEMQLSAQQCIMKYTYTSDADFLRKLCSCPDLLPCLGQPKAASAPEPVAAPAKTAPNVVKSVDKPRQGKKPADKKRIGILAGVVAAVAVLAIVLIIALNGGGEDKGGQSLDNQGTTASTTLGPTEPEDTGHHLEYADQIITAQDVAYINQQTQLETLLMYNCTVEEGAFDNLELPAAMTEIHLENCTGVKNLQSLATLENLNTLKIINCGIADGDIPKLTGKELWFVDVSGNFSFTDLQIFADCIDLCEIRFVNTAVASVEALAGMTELERVDGSYTKVKDLTAVANLTELLEVRFAGCGIESIETPFCSLHLELVDLSRNALVDADFLTNCAALQYVDLSYNNLMYPEKLVKSADYLRGLNLSGNLHLYDFHLEFLEKCVHLESLALDGVIMEDLSLLKSMSNLKYLSLVCCGIVSLEHLKQMTELEYLNLALNNISDISPLEHIVSAELILDLSFNSYLTDLSTLPERSYSILNLVGCDIDPYSVPAVSGEVLMVGFDDAWKDFNCTGGDNFTCVMITDCPLDQVVAMEKRFGQDRLLVQNDVGEFLQQLEMLGVDCSYLAMLLDMM